MIDARAGSGGMGDIYKGVDRETGTPVAIKLLRPIASDQERARFAREVAVLAELRHPNIVQYIAHGTWHDGRLFFAMEWLDGEDLGQRQRRAPLGMRDAVEVVRRSAAAMAAIHARGVVHRDLKLSNIFLLRGRGTAVKLIDFGVVKPQVPDEYPTERGTIIGTPHFMAPEQARGEPIDARADVYSLGSVLFRLITGRNVFETEHVIALLGRLVLEDPPRAQHVRFDVPEALDDLIARCIARDRNERFEDGGELSRALARVAAHVVDNDPPATDRSASAVRKATQVPESKPLSSTSDVGTPSRPGSSERRVVACVLYDLGGATISPDLDASLRDLLGDDARIETLASGQVVTLLGTERSRGDEAMRAARAGLTVARALPSARIAVAMGRATRGRQSLAGEALDRAARQLEATSPGTVRLDASARTALEGRFVIQEDTQGGVLLQEDPLGVGGRRLLGRPSPTVGRDHEITLLQGIYSDVLADRTPRAVLVTGAAGIGKSRVCSDIIQRLEASAQPPLVMLSRGDPMSRSASLSGFGRALRAMMGIHDGESHDVQVQKVTYHVSTRLPRPLRFLSAFLGEIVGVPFPDDGDEPLRAARASAQIMQSRMRMALEAYVRSQAERAPLLAVIDDLHWIDDTTLDLVDWLLGCTELPFVVFAFGRPESEARHPHLWERRNVTRLALPPLSPHAADRLVAAVLTGSTPAVRAARAAIVQRAGGNALFLEELVRSVAEGRDEIPMTVQALVQLRLDRLPTDAREVLRAASVFGHAFWTSGVEALLARPIDTELSALEASEIITRQPHARIAGQVEWMFSQTLVRDVVYASLLDEDRAALHLAAGTWLEAAGDVDAALIARHADAGGDLQRAAALYAQATHHALLHGAELVTALELAHRGLACGAEGVLRTQLLLDKAHAHAGMGQLSEGIQAAQEAAHLAPPDSELWGEAHRLAASTLIEAGRSAEGDAIATWAARPDIAPSLSPALRASLLAVRVRSLYDLDRPREALDVARHAVDIARASGAPVAVTRALDALLFAMPAGEVSDAIATGHSLIQAAEAAGDTAIATRARLNTASMLNQVGLFEDAQAMLMHALGDARDRRMRILEAAALHNLGMSHARVGKMDSGVEYERQAGLIADECHAARLRIHTRTYEIIFLIWRSAPGDLATALALSGRLQEETSRHPALQLGSWFALARVQLARQAYEAALPAAREAYQRLAAGPVEEWEEYTRLTLVESLLAVGLTTEADAVLDEAFRSLLDRAQRIHNPYQRSAFLRRNDEVDRLLQLARERLGRVLPPLDPVNDHRTPTMGPGTTT
ncbi:serine/threonine-protein kinase PknK [Chondromyces crocatus]|uniref:serine/threonine-protein kinase n=1 Tax=Chondromyces crocatus TaxID=52 RepID=UPI00247FABD2|nr:serine/threonine-protein kinase [Chondromyces crocatus]